MEEAVAAVSRAIALDNAHDNEAAYDAYKEALGMLLPLVRSTCRLLARPYNCH